ncbi:hypothetical protein CANTEDRAFT_114158 [Yamadazyma tenuis ATCC 10573]|uniref:Uncharacterized protein n=1 Tax=Candida tenuis (strain ATCC 10573 / BCRC 21748 / CBS 615 / JCM 9827 / NBRC 10315 / NRRL Y-1498 / VKM Y-70) TaxID=590646 RepID=G3B3C5_CANTC|nr:uncharacterized protein CANTEDRAFT_114158 [Yamadazyma tenuis ATCC 10573]EGV64136.1 hypothetical protein CANTEDRAFT_114158 [Yamadazyma tenuis ATCC 10573]
MSPFAGGGIQVFSNQNRFGFERCYFTFSYTADAVHPQKGSRYYQGGNHPPPSDPGPGLANNSRVNTLSHYL